MTKTTKILLGVLILVLLAAGGFFCFDYFKQSGSKVALTSEPNLVDKDKIVVGNNASYVSGIYPTKMSPSSQEIGFYSNVFQPLASFDKERRILPGSGLASSWTNPEPTTWRFIIDPKAKFSDNSPVLASDVKFTYDEVIKNSYQIGTLLPPIKEVKVVNSQTVDFITASPNPILVNKISNLLIVSEKNIAKNGTDNPIGSGPYKLSTADTTKGELSHLVINPNYWRVQPKVKEIIVKNIVPKENETQDKAYADALLAKEIDIALIGEKSPLTSLKSDSGITTKSCQDASVSFLSLNSLADSPLSNLEVRKALDIAIDPKAVIATFDTPVQIVDQIVPSMIFGYNPDIKRPALDIAKAKAMLATAGYPNGFTLNFMGFEGSVFAAALKPQLEQIGVTLVNNIVSGEDYMNNLMTGNYITTYAAFSADSGDASEVLEQLFHSKGETMGTSNMGYSNKAVDDLIEKTASTMDMKQRLVDLKQTIKLITDDVAYIPLYTSVSTYAIRKDIYWQPRVDGHIMFNEMAGLEQ